MYEQSIEIVAFFQGKIFLSKNLAKITFKHHLSEMYLLHDKDQPLSFHNATRQPSFPMFYHYQVIEESRWQMSKKYDNVKHSYQSENDTFSTVYIQNMAQLYIISISSV